MSITRNSFRRPVAFLAALSVLAGAAAPALLGSVVHAAGQVTSRSIQLSDSAQSGNSNIASGVGSGTNVSYKVTFTAVTSANVGGIVVDICDNTPLIGDTTCTYPTGFGWGNLTAAPVTVTSITGTWTVTSYQAGGSSASLSQVIKLSNSAPATPSGAVTFTISGVTNPSTASTPSSAHTYYARIVTFDTAASMSQYTTTGTARAGTMANMIDNGGIALSLVLPITVTARVMESFALCIAKAAYTGVACAGPTGTDTPSITLGHTANNILTSSQIDTANIYTQISTNAVNGYAVYLRAGNLCAGLSRDGSTCGIPAVNSGGATGATITAGTAAFGALVTDGSASSGGSGTNTAVARWKTTAPTYIMDNTTANDNVGHTYGSKIFSAAGQANAVANTITFAATASSTTPAGIYTENFSLIGVGTF